jgi:hypothetical protein
VVLRATSRLASVRRHRELTARDRPTAPVHRVDHHSAGCGTSRVRQVANLFILRRLSSICSSPLYYSLVLLSKPCQLSKQLLSTIPLLGELVPQRCYCLQPFYAPSWHATQPLPGPVAEPQPVPTPALASDHRSPVVFPTWFAERNAATTNRLAGERSCKKSKQHPA